MGRVVADRVLESSTTTGTGSYTLIGAVTGFITFAAAPCQNGDSVEYYAEDIDANGNPSGGFEAGIGIWTTGNVLIRDTIISSSNAGAAVSWSAGTRRIGLTILARELMPLGIMLANATGQAMP